MYSKKIELLLKKKRIKPSDRILVKTGGKEYEGLLMPKTEVGDPTCVVLKLNTGYNFGIECKGNFDISHSKHKTPKNIKEERAFELGKINKDLVRIKYDASKPAVSLIATGGTVASRVDYKTGGVTGMMDPKEFLHNVPELSKIANLKRVVCPFTKMSEDMDYLDWQEIATVVAKELNSSAEGVIVIHGTDTLQYTSAALSFFLRGLTKPVVLMGSQRSSDRGSSDAGMNLICSAHIAKSELSGVGICMHGHMSDDYCMFMRGTKVKKMHTSRRDAFRPINDLPIAKVWSDGKILKIGDSIPRRKGKVEVDSKFEPKVAIVKAYPGADPKVLDFYADKGYKGIVIEGTAFGHVPTFARKPWIETVKKLTKKGIAVVVTSQSIYGRVNANVYTNLRILFHETGAIPADDMLTETAYVKLGWVLGHTKVPGKVREMMLTNYAGEITKRSLPETFLY
ncbi:MAG: Glu-tRNA(Gln) amidotransferase subunit GatD [Candidatus Aenigmatarchaeota archaeon]